MDAPPRHIVILGGPEPEPELLAIVLDDGQAIPIFDSTEEADEFLTATGDDFARDWYAIEVSPGDLSTLLEHQTGEVRHIAISPPPEKWTGGMEIQVLDIETFAMLLDHQAGISDKPEEEPKEKPKRGFFRRIFGR